MKHMYSVVTLALMFCISVSINAQSISASKILGYLNGQKQSVISADLLKLGFTQPDKKESTTFTGYAYTKKGELGIEYLSIVINDEIFSVLYKPATTALYSALKEKMLTKDFVYTYSYLTAKYYESSDMRIGINDTNNVISFFVKKK